MKWRSHILFPTIPLVGIVLSSCIGCANPDRATGQVADSLRTFRRMLESSTDSLRLSKAESEGRHVFMRYCQVCHGGAGDGKGFNAFNLQSSFGVQPADFSDSTFIAGVLDEEIVLAISMGGKAVGKSQYMPPWGNTLSDEEVQNAAAFIKTFSRAKEQTGPAE